MKKSKFSILLLLVMILQSSFPAFSAKNCECGTHAGGMITYYSVGDNEGCCTGLPTEIGTEIYYVPDEGGTYSVSDRKNITGAAAQDSCCPPM